MNNPNSRCCCKTKGAQRELLVEMIHLMLNPGYKRWTRNAEDVMR